MLAIKCAGGYQCSHCLWVMLFEPFQESPDVPYNVTLSCSNQNCKNHGKKYEFPKADLVELTECQ